MKIKKIFVLIVIVFLSSLPFFTFSVFEEFNTLFDLAKRTKAFTLVTQIQQKSEELGILSGYQKADQTFDYLKNVN